ncbi:MAG: PaaI family thioesterase [Caulobacteraceae bacterium]
MTDAGYDGDPIVVESGEFAGWSVWSMAETFGGASGPFHFREEGDHTRCAVRIEKRHLNRVGAAHGGFLTTFADVSLYMMTRRARGGAQAVTVSLNAEFVGAAVEGDILEMTGEIVRAGGSLIFLRGVAAVGDRPVLMFSGVLKRLGKR